MVSRCCLVLAIFGSIVLARAADPASEVTSVVSLPPSLLGETDPIRQTIKGLSRLEENKASSFSGTAFDARPFLEKIGVDKIDLVEAVYLLDQKVLILRGNRDQVEQIDAYLMSLDCNNPSSLKHEMVLVSFRSNGDSLASPARTYEELRKLAGDSWRELVRAEINSKHGMRAAAVAIDGEVMKGDRVDLPPGAQGSVFEIESALRGDGVGIDAYLVFKYRAKLEGVSSPINIQYVGQTSLWDGRPQVLQVSPFGSDGELCALLLRITMIWPSTERVIGEAPQR